MRIVHPNGTSTDTDKMNDCSAELVERVVDLFNFCKQRKIPLFLRYCDPNLKAPIGSVMCAGAYNLATSKEFLTMMKSIDDYFFAGAGRHVLNWREVEGLVEDWDKISGKNGSLEGEHS